MRARSGLVFRLLSCLPLLVSLGLVQSKLRDLRGLLLRHVVVPIVLLHRSLLLNLWRLHRFRHFFVSELSLKWVNLINDIFLLFINRSSCCLWLVNLLE